MNCLAWDIAIFDPAEDTGRRPLDAGIFIDAPVRQNTWNGTELLAGAVFLRMKGAVAPDAFAGLRP